MRVGPVCCVCRPSGPPAATRSLRSPPQARPCAGRGDVRTPLPRVGDRRRTAGRRPTQVGPDRRLAATLITRHHAAELPDPACRTPVSGRMLRPGLPQAALLGEGRRSHQAGGGNTLTLERVCSGVERGVRDDAVFPSRAPSRPKVVPEGAPAQVAREPEAPNPHLRWQERGAHAPRRRTFLVSPACGPPSRGVPPWAGRRS